MSNWFGEQLNNVDPTERQPTPEKRVESGEPQSEWDRSHFVQMERNRQTKGGEPPEDWAEKEAREWLTKWNPGDEPPKVLVADFAVLLRRMREEGDAATYQHAIEICAYQQSFYDELSDAQGYHALKVAIEKIRAAAIRKGEK